MSNPISSGGGHKFSFLKMLEGSDSKSKKSDSEEEKKEASASDGDTSLEHKLFNINKACRNISFDLPEDLEDSFNIDEEKQHSADQKEVEKEFEAMLNCIGHNIPCPITLIKKPGENVDKPKGSDSFED